MGKQIGEEKKIQNEILDWALHQSCISSIYQNTRHSLRGRRIITKYNPPGLPDINGSMRGGRALYIEVKKDLLCIERAPEDQKEFIIKEARNGSLAFFAASLEDVIRKFKEEGYKC